VWESLQFTFSLFLEFLKFALYQEAWRQKWFEAEAELKRLHNQLNDVNQNFGKDEEKLRSSRGY
jgi:hypothetical protein